MKGIHSLTHSIHLFVWSIPWARHVFSLTRFKQKSLVETVICDLILISRFNLLLPLIDDDNWQYQIKYKYTNDNRRRDW